MIIPGYTCVSAHKALPGFLSLFFDVISISAKHSSAKGFRLDALHAAGNFLPESSSPILNSFSVPFQSTLSKVFIVRKPICKPKTKCMLPGI